MGKKFQVDRYGPSEIDAPPDVLREIPKDDERTQVTVKPLFKGVKPVGIQIEVKGKY